MTNNLIISVDELWLKGRNQKMYLKACVGHIDNVLRAYHEDKFRLSKQGQRLYYESKTPFTMETIEALSLIPGIAYITPSTIIPLGDDMNLDQMYAAIVEEVSYLKDQGKTFRATVKKNHQKFPMTSTEIERDIGAHVLKNYPLAKVSLVTYELKIEARIYPHHITIATKTFRGVGGLPWGTNGHALCLLSGGFDSPVAAYMMNKRGIRQDFVFFHAYPFVGREVLQKIKSLASRLSQFQRQSHLYIVSFGDIQNKIAEHAQEEYKTMLFRKAMVEISNKLARKIGAGALVTGDSLGQVSSQTMGNMHLMDNASEIMIMRPLLGFNKLDIMGLATQIKTHDTSLIPHDDACALFAPKNPIINPNVEYWNKVNLEEILKEEYETIFEKTDVFSINLKGEIFKKEFFSYDRK